jgi:hypothetical protein
MDDDLNCDLNHCEYPPIYKGVTVDFISITDKDWSIEGQATLNCSGGPNTQDFSLYLIGQDSLNMDLTCPIGEDMSDAPYLLDGSSFYLTDAPIFQ